jgi:hypothetical protein
MAPDNTGLAVAAATQHTERERARPIGFVAPHSKLVGIAQRVEHIEPLEVGLTSETLAAQELIVVVCS